MESHPTNLLGSPVREVGSPPESAHALTDADGVLLNADEPCLRWFGLPADQPIPRPLASVLESLHPGWSVEILRLLASPAPFASGTLPQSPDDDGLPIEVTRIRSGTGSVFTFRSQLPDLQSLAESSWDAHLRDDQQLRQMFVRLVRAESNLERLASCFPGVVFIQRPDLTFEFVSQRVLDATGHTAEAWKSGVVRQTDVIHEKDLEEFHSMVRQANSGEETVSTTYRIRNAITGRVSYVLEQRKALHTRNGLVLGYEGTWVDVSRQAIAEKRLAGASWKETLALLTMGLAHDFGNILSGIHSLSESFVAQTDDSHPFHEGLTLIRNNALEATQIVRRIVNLHRGKTGQSGYCDMNEIARDVSDLMRKVVSRNVELHVALDPRPLPLYTDPVALRQVLINIALNAADAMQGGGRLEIRSTRWTEAPTPAFLKGTLPRLPAVGLAIRDTGCGIRRSQFDAIFSPFFTTKALLRKGSGLGLYNAFLFVEKHKGGISVTSQEGVGTTFELLLAESDFTEADIPSDPSSTRRHNLLLVSADPEAVRLTSEFLRTHGYSVVIAASAEDAADMLVSPEYSFSGAYLLVDDPDSPLINSLLPGLRKQQPALKTILHITSCNQDDLDTRFVWAADLVLTDDTPEADVIEGLDVLFSPASMPGL